MKLASLGQCLDHHRQTTGIEEFLHQVVTRRLQVHNRRDITAQPIPVIKRQIDADTSGNGKQVNNRVGRTTDCAVDPDGVLERFLGHNVRRFQVILDHLNDTATGNVRHDATAAVHGRNGRITRKRHTKRLGHAGHGGCGTHGVARARRPRHGNFSFEEIFGADLAGLAVLGKLPQRCARSDILTTPFAIEHRPTGDNNRRDINAGRPHQKRGRGFIAADHQDNAIKRRSAQHFLDIHGCKVTEHHRGRAQRAFTSGKHREFKRKTTSLVDAVFDAFGQIAQMGITWGQFRPGVTNANHRTSVKQIRWQALVLHPAAVIDIVLAGSAEPPLLRAEGTRPGCRFELRHARFPF